MSPPLRPCQPSGAILRHNYSAVVTTLSDTARTYSDYSGPRGGVTAYAILKIPYDNDDDDDDDTPSCFSVYFGQMAVISIRPSQRLHQSHSVTLHEKSASPKSSANLEAGWWFAI